MTTPPMVGVPRLISAELRPSTRIGWPYPYLRSTLMSSGVMNSASSSDTAPVTITVLIWTPPGLPRQARHWLGLQPFGIEDAETEGDAEPGDQPEPDDDRGLGPAAHLEVMLQRCHLEDPFSGHLEETHLDDHRQRDDREQAAEDAEQQLGLGADSKAGQHAAESQRAGVAHVDLGRRRVPPQEAETGAEYRGRHHGQVQRVPDLVALLGQEGRAVVAFLPDADQYVGGQHQYRRPGRQAVEAGGQVHRVGGAGDQDDDPDHERQRAERRA